MQAWSAAAVQALVIIVIYWGMAALGLPWPPEWFVLVGTLSVGYRLTLSYYVNRRRNKIS